MIEHINNAAAGTALAAMFIYFVGGCVDYGRELEMTVAIATVVLFAGIVVWNIL